MKKLKYSQALSEGLVAAMHADKNIFVTGIAVDYPSGIFGTTNEALSIFGPKRVFDSPAMENALMGIAIGAAAVGKRPVIVHPRADFMFLAFDQLINLAAKWSYMYGGNAGKLPIVIRAIIGKGWGQGATHSQSLQAPLAHFPGLTVLMPATANDARDLMFLALQHDGPVVMLEHRSLFDLEGDVCEEVELLSLGKAAILREGGDVTVVATSYMVVEAMRAAKELEKMDLSVEVINLRSIRPLDEETILTSLKKTGRVVVADTSWIHYGVASEIAALVAEKGFSYLRAPVKRIGLADCPAPVSRPLEEAFYPHAATICKAVLSVMDISTLIDIKNFDDTFRGPY